MITLHKKGGFIRMAFIVIIIILILSYVGIDLKSFIESDKTQSNLSYVWGGVLWMWDTVINPVWSRYIYPVWSYFWGFIGPTLENFGEGSLNPFSDKTGISPLEVEF